VVGDYERVIPACMRQNNPGNPLATILRVMASFEGYGEF
jgi:hypothetical protein